MRSSKHWNLTAAAVAAFLVLAAVAPFAQQQGGGSQSGTQAAGGSLEQAWATPAELKTPESALYDPGRDVIFVSNVNGDPAAKDGNGFISRVSPDGQILDLQWVTGLDAPKGLGIRGGHLFAADIDQLVEIDIESGQVVRHWPAEGAVALNDVAVDGQDNVYVSDWSQEHSAVYRLNDQGLELWVRDDRLAQPNGLLSLDSALVVGTGQAELLRISYESREISVLADLSGNLSMIDGIARRSENTLLVSDWNGVVVQVRADQPLSGEGGLGAAAGQALQVTPLLDVRAQKINTADIGVIRDQNLLLAPTFLDNRVIAYRLPGEE